MQLLQWSIPIILFMLCLAIQVGFTGVFQSAFEDDRVFPFNKRATAINIIILVSKTLTIAAPFINELEEPIPVIVIGSVAIFILILIIFYPSKAQLDSMTKV